MVLRLEGFPLGTGNVELILIMPVEHHHKPLIISGLFQLRTFHKKADRCTVGIGFSCGQQYGLMFRIGFLIRAMRHKRRVRKGPEQAVQRIAPLFTDGLNRYTPTTPQRAFDKARQGFIQCRFRQMVKSISAMPCLLEGR